MKVIIELELSDNAKVRALELAQRLADIAARVLHAGFVHPVVLRDEAGGIIGDMRTEFKLSPHACVLPSVEALNAFARRQRGELDPEKPQAQPQGESWVIPLPVWGKR